MPVPLYLFLMVIVCLSCGTIPAADDVDPKRAVVSTIGMIAGWSILAHVAVRMVAISVRSGDVTEINGARWIEKSLEVFRWGGIAVSVFCLLGFQLAAAMQDVPQINNSLFLQAVILLLPATTVTMATISAEHFYGVLLGYASLKVRDYLREMTAGLRACTAWLILPVLALLGAADLIGLLLSSNSPNTGWLVALMALVFVPVVFPILVKRLFRTQTLDSETASWIGEIFAGADVGKTRVARWDTGGKSHNAMVAGFIRPFRTALVSDRLLDEMTRPQIAMVILHEAAHLRRRHMPIRMLGVSPAWIAGALVTKIAGENTYAMMLGTIAGILLTTLLLRIIALRTEFDADDQACRIAEQMAGSVTDVPAGYQDAAKTLAEALERVCVTSPAARRASWMHPGLDARLENLGIKPSSVRAWQSTEPAISPGFPE